VCGVHQAEAEKATSQDPEKGEGNGKGKGRRRKQSVAGYDYEKLVEFYRINCRTYTRGKHNYVYHKSSLVQNFREL